MSTHHGVKATDYVFLDVRQEHEGTKWPYVLYASRFVDGVATGTPARQVLGNGASLLKEIKRNVDYGLTNTKVSVVVQVVDKTSAGHFGVYYTNGRMVRGEIQSVHGMLGPRCTPMPAGPKPEMPGGVSARERRKTMSASRLWEQLQALVDSGQFWFKLGERPDQTEVRNSAKSPGANWIKATSAHLAAIVYPAILQQWKGARTFGTFPVFPAGNPVGTQTSFGDLAETFKRVATETGKQRTSKRTREAETATAKTAKTPRQRSPRAAATAPALVPAPAPAPTPTVAAPATTRRSRSTTVTKPPETPKRTRTTTPAAPATAATGKAPKTGKTGKTPAPDMSAAAGVVGAMVKNLFA